MILWGIFFTFLTTISLIFCGKCSADHGTYAFGCRFLFGKCLLCVCVCRVFFLLSCSLVISLLSFVCLFILCFRALLFHFRFSIVIIPRTHGGTVTLHLRWLCLWVSKVNETGEKTNDSLIQFLLISLFRLQRGGFFFLVVVVVVVEETTSLKDNTQHREAIWDNEDKSVFFAFVLMLFYCGWRWVLRAKRFTCIHYYFASFSLQSNRIRSDGREKKRLSSLFIKI